MSEAPQDEGASATFSAQPVDSDGGRQLYTIPGVLHFLQHEWTRFERERSNWEVERAELKTKIAFLQGERKGQENLKRDLLRRIKMLEYALKQERAKVHRMQNGMEENPSEPVKIKRQREPVRDMSSAVSEVQQASRRQGRHLLRQYLQEIGYADAVIGVRTSRINSLLSHPSSDSLSAFGASTSVASQHLPASVSSARKTSVDGPPNTVPVESVEASLFKASDSESSKKVHRSSLNVTLKSRGMEQTQDEQLVSSPVKPKSPELTSFPGSNSEEGLFEEETVVAHFNFLKDLADGDEDDKDSDEDEDDGAKGSNKLSRTQLDKNALGNVDLLDPDQEAAIAEFEFLSHEAEEEDHREPPSRPEEEFSQELIADSGPTSGQHSSLYLGGNEWKLGLDPEQLSKLKDEYKQDRKKKAQQSKRPTHSQLQQMMTSLNQGDEVGLTSNFQSVLPVSNTDITEESVLNSEMPTFGPRIPRKTKRALLQTDGGRGAPDGESVGLGLGDLANLPEHIHNEAESQYGTTAPKTWSQKYSLKSHFDCVRSLAYHPTEPILVTASEDCTLKLWNIQKPPQARRSNICDLEPVYAFRGHRAAVWCCCASLCGSYVFSGSSDMTICRWLLPSSSCDTYGPYGGCHELTDKFRRILRGHTDAVWDLVVLPGHDNVLVSCAADSTCRLWRHDAEQPLLATVDISDGQPTSVDSVPCNPQQWVTGFTNGKGIVYDVETASPVVTFNDCPEQGGLQRINRVASHPTLPVTVTAHEDRHLRFYDNRTGRQLHSMVAHTDGVTSLAVDPNGLFVVSGSHDCSLRLWNFDTKSCVDDITSHRKKYEESICDIAFHPVHPMIGSAGADSIVKVFM
ncbi:striatin-like isoform X2 [Corticium candelabrum]|uniref:striatin-like isoform X2 n=1 Tax=Corticium candelabrum TaxID=121492 RepID=UPI002E25C357|nr:striatin-like isoform X2 [Corticium candelabrum]